MCKLVEVWMQANKTRGWVGAFLMALALTGIGVQRDALAADKNGGDAPVARPARLHVRQ